MSLPYYPMYPRDFFEGTQEMSLEQKGAYIMVLNLMYTRGGPISDEPGFVSRYVGCSVKKWKAVCDQLVAMGKLVRENGMISNSRADQELVKQRSYQDQKAENGSQPKSFKAEEKRALPQSKPEPKVIEKDEDGRANVFDDLEAKCRKWANGSLNLTVPSAHSLDPIIRLLSPPSGPACIEADLERGITKTAAWLHSKGRQVKSLSYFEKAIIEARDERLRPNPEISNEAPQLGRNGRGGPNQGSGGSGGYGGGNGAARPGGQPRTGNLAASKAWLQRMREEEAGVPDESQDWRDERVA